MTLDLNCKNAGGPVCTLTMYDETEEELIANAKEAWNRGARIIQHTKFR